MDCVFCKIVNGELPSTKLYEDDEVIAFDNIAPMAKVHILIIPKKHILSCVNDVNHENSNLIARVFEVAQKLACDLGLENGYRIVTNTGKHACQSVHHLHFHLIGGEQLSENMA